MDFDFDPLRTGEEEGGRRERKKVGGRKVFPPPMETRENLGEKKWEDGLRGRFLCLISLDQAPPPLSPLRKEGRMCVKAEKYR